MAVGRSSLAGWKIIKYFITSDYDSGSGSPHTSNQTVRQRNAILNWHWLVILFQERDRSPAPGRAATRSLPDLTSWRDISELTRERRTLSAPCVTRDSWDQITWGKQDRTCPPSPLYKLLSVLSVLSFTMWRPQHNTDTLTLQAGKTEDNFHGQCRSEVRELFV